MSALQRERTDWRPTTDPSWEQTWLWPDYLWMPVVASGVQHTLVNVGLLEKAWLDAFTSHVTTVPRRFVLTSSDVPEVDDSPETPAQGMTAELRRLSGLTNEEIAPLLGVSRRSLQSWIAGESISARKEARLRATLDAIRQLTASRAVDTRDRLLAREPQSVSAYDLLTEERYDAAVDLALGRRRRSTPETKTSESLDAQLGRIEDNIAPAPRLNRKLSGPLKR